jgi:hypothetical protein
LDSASDWSLNHKHGCLEVDVTYLMPRKMMSVHLSPGEYEMGGYCVYKEIIPSDRDSEESSAE